MPTDLTRHQVKTTEVATQTFTLPRLTRATCRQMPSLASQLRIIRLVATHLPLVAVSYLASQLGHELGKHSYGALFEDLVR